jgi:hypothetical protein
LSSLRESFLSRFDTPLRSEIIQYGKRLSEASKTCDVLLLMARKAVCLAECLESLRLARFECAVTSDRVLDSNSSWLASKRVTIFDDALISGTTLYRTIERVHISGVKRADIQRQVLCVNKRWHSPDLVKPDGPYLELDDDETASLCARIVEAISILPRPYALDYPLFKKIRLPKAALSSITALDDWVADEVTTPLQAAHNVFTITFTPSQRVLADLDDSLGWRFTDRSLNKVRLYGRSIKHDPHHYWCSMFPVVAMEPLAVETVAQLFESVAGHTGDKKVFSHWFSPVDRRTRKRAEAPSRLRLISFVAASRLAGIWFDDVNKLLPNPLERIQSTRAHGYLFPPARD